MKSRDEILAEACPACIHRHSASSEEGCYWFYVEKCPRQSGCRACTHWRSSAEPPPCPGCYEGKRCHLYVPREATP